MNEIFERAIKGLPLENIQIIDCHCHMGFWHRFHIPENTAEGMLQNMDSLGIAISCVAHHSSIFPNYRFGNDEVIKALEKYPKRFIGYATLNPHYPEDMKNEIDRCFSFPGIRGIKLHPDCHGCTIDYRNYHIAYEVANEKGCPVLIHVWGQDQVAIMGKLAGQYPKAKFIMGHAGGGIRAMEDAIEVVVRHDNVFADLALSRTYEGNVEWLAREMGADKVLFGTDHPFLDPRPTLGRVALAEISDEDKSKIFGRNMARLLGI
jgi:Predicted metal-dependent hydrolase of the TIM-barrel fold